MKHLGTFINCLLCHNPLRSIKWCVSVVCSFLMLLLSPYLTSLEFLHLCHLSWMTATAACMVFSRDGGGVESSVDVSIISAPELKFKTQMGTTDLLRSPRPDSCFPFFSFRVKWKKKRKTRRPHLELFLRKNSFNFFALSVIVHFRLLITVGPDWPAAAMALLVECGCLCFYN